MIRCPSEPPPPSLDEIARRVGRLAPSWQRPERFYRQRDDLADALHQIARGSLPGALGRVAGPSTREQRLAALLALKNDELARLRRLLAEAQPRPRRQQRMPDGRQLSLAL
jgi:hypothetical protein